LKYYSVIIVIASTSRMPPKVNAQTMEAVCALLALARSNDQLDNHYYLRNRTQPTGKPVASEPVAHKRLLRDRNQLKQPSRFD